MDFDRSILPRAGYLVDLSSGKLLSISSLMSPQILFGEARAMFGFAATSAMFGRQYALDAVERGGSPSGTFSYNLHRRLPLDEVDSEALLCKP